MKKMLTWGFSVCIFLSSWCFANNQFSETGQVEYVPNEIIVRFAQSPALQEKQIEQRQRKEEILQNARLSSVQIANESKRISGLCRIILNDEESVEQAIEKLKGNPEILYAQPNYVYYSHQTFPNDPAINDDPCDSDNVLWGLHNVGRVINGLSGIVDCDIDAPEAWDTITDACDIIVAIVDSGINYNHSDLAANIWVNEAELYGDPNLDDDGNGYVNDIYGWDFINEDSDPIDDNGHGSHCAGTIGAVGDNELGISGVCWKVKLMGVKCLNAYGNGTTYSVAESITYAVDNGANIINMSLGGPSDSTFYDAMEYAYQNDVLVVASAGNSNRNVDAIPSYPACYDFDNIISVMATDNCDRRSDWSEKYNNRNAKSNYGNTAVDLGAPGSEIYSTILNSGYGYYDGTSMAAPHVSGACALMMQYYPDWSLQEIKAALLATVDIPTPALDCTSGGRLNLARAISYKFPLLGLSKIDDVPDSIGDPNDPCYPICTCRDPGDLVTYTICYAPDANDHTNLELIDYLPWGTDFYDADPNESVDAGYYYSLFEHRYYWGLDDIEGVPDPNDPCALEYCLEITLRVNEYAEPTGEIVNIASIESDDSFTKTSETTQVCCWGGDVIYVNADAPASSFESGTSWNDCYRNLYDALNRASVGCGDEIWIAKGVYIPGDDADSTFTIPDGVTIYGGFAGNESDPCDRDITNNLTILSGNNVCERLIIASNQQNSITFDGLVFGNAKIGNLYFLLADANLNNCWILNSQGQGVTSTYSSISLQNCVIKDNAQEGIYSTMSGYTLEATNCIIANNGYNGIRCSSVIPTIKNCFIHNNGEGAIGSETGYGILLNNVNSTATISNNTIVYNKDIGIYSSTNTTSHDISNCILWHNDLYGEISQIYNCSAYYSCVTDPNDPNGGTSTPDATFSNITCNPDFAYADADFNFHLASDSPCIDLGDPSTTGTGETDIDGQGRVYNSRVDMGADEFNCDGEPSNDYDFNGDGLLNLYEFALFKPVWLSDPNSDPNDPNTPTWDASLDLNDDDSVDMVDLTILAESWRWEACYWTDAWLQLNQTITVPLVDTEGGISSQVYDDAVEYRLTNQRPQEPTLQDIYWLWEEILDSVLAEYDSGYYSLTEEEMMDLIDAIYDIMDDIEQEWLQQQ